MVNLLCFCSDLRMKTDRSDRRLDWRHLGLIQLVISNASRLIFKVFSRNIAQKGALGAIAVFYVKSNQNPNNPV